MSVTTEDVQEGVAQIWNAATAVTSLVTSLTLGRVEQSATAPYAGYEVEDGEIVREAQGSGLLKFTVTFKTWDQTGATDAGPIKLAIEGAFTIRTRTVLTLASGRTLKIIDSLKHPGKLNEDEATNLGRAVKIATDVFEILCQG